MSIANPNWLSVVGLLTAGVGVALLATAMVSTARLAGASELVRERAAPSLGTLGTFGGTLALAGFFVQSMAQFYAVSRGAPVVLMLLGLMAVLAVYGIKVLGWPPAAAATDALAQVAPAAAKEAPAKKNAPPPAAPEAAPADASEPPPAASASPAAVKLVSSG